MIVATHYLRFFSIALAATAVVHGQANVIGVTNVVIDIEVVVDVAGPIYPLTEDCDPCTLIPDGQDLIDGCAGTNPLVLEIITRDSTCGRNWDAFCLVEYNDCYNNACGAARQALIDSIAQMGGPENQSIDWEQIVRDRNDYLLLSR